MSTFKKYLSVIREDRLLTQEEARVYLEEMIRRGEIVSYDETILGKIKDGISIVSLITLLSASPIKAGQMSNIVLPEIDQVKTETVVNIKKDLQDLELQITSLRRHTKQFQNSTAKYEVELVKTEKKIKELKNSKSFDDSKLTYYQQRIDALRIYLQKGAEINDKFDKDMENLEKENNIFLQNYQKNEKNKKTVE